MLIIVDCVSAVFLLYTNADAKHECINQTMLTITNNKLKLHCNEMVVTITPVFEATTT